MSLLILGFLGLALFSWWLFYLPEIRGGVSPSCPLFWSLARSRASRDAELSWIEASEWMTGRKAVYQEDLSHDSLEQGPGCLP